MKQGTQVVTVVAMIFFTGICVFSARYMIDHPVRQVKFCIEGK